MAVKTSLVPHVIDALLTMFRALTGITDADGNPWTPLVYDGFPGLDQEAIFITIGGTQEPTATGTQEFISLGQPNAAPSRDERVEIRCYATAYVGGDDSGGVSGNSDAQKSARDIAYQIVNAAETALRANPNLTGLGGAAPGVYLVSEGWCEFARGDLIQTNAFDPEATKGRTATVEFFVGYYQRLYSF